MELVAAQNGHEGIFQLEGGIAAASCSGQGFSQSDDVAMVLFTSGSTSEPKMVPLTHASLCRSARLNAEVLELTTSDRCLNVMPLFHIHGVVFAVLSSLSVGSSVVCPPG